MHLTRKELAHYVWTHPTACEARGLTINQGFFTRCCRYQRLRLGEYGTAPLANVRFWPGTNTYYAQVIAFTGALAMEFYHRAKRYGAGLKTIIEHTIRAEQITAQIVVSVVLICERTEHPRGSHDLLFTLNLDQDCQVFTYCYGLEGIRFQNIGKQWHLIGPSGMSGVYRGLQDDIRAEYVDALRWWAKHMNGAARTATDPGQASNLVVTAGGVVEREDVTEEGQDDE